MATIPTQVRIDENLKKQATELFSQLGMDMSSAMNIFLSGYSCAAEPPVQYRLSHLSRRSEPLIKHTICMMRIYSRNALSNPYTSRMEISCSASMLVMLMR